MRASLPTLPCLLALTLAFGLVGCAATKKVWHKPGMTQDEWVVDSANCRSRAQRLAERDFAIQPGAEPGGVDNGAGYDALMRRHSAKRNMEDIYRRCLERKGYRLVAPAPAVKT